MSKFNKPIEDSGNEIKNYSMWLYRKLADYFRENTQEKEDLYDKYLDYGKEKLWISDHFYDNFCKYVEKNRKKESDNLSKLKSGMLTKWNDTKEIIKGKIISILDNYKDVRDKQELYELVKKEMQKPNKELVRFNSEKFSEITLDLSEKNIFYESKYSENKQMTSVVYQVVSSIRKEERDVLERTNKFPTSFPISGKTLKELESSSGNDEDFKVSGYAIVSEQELILKYHVDRFNQSMILAAHYKKWSKKLFESSDIDKKDLSKYETIIEKTEEDFLKEEFKD
jgi:hypothetical protein